jgi:hypothetical protein
MTMSQPFLRCAGLSAMSGNLPHSGPPCADDIVAGAWLDFNFRVHFPRFGSIQWITQTLLRQL